MIILKMEDDSDYFENEDDHNLFSQMEDDLNILVNGREPKTIKI